MRGTEPVRDIALYAPHNADTKDLYFSATSGTTTGVPVVCLIKDPINTVSARYRFEGIDALLRVGPNNARTLWRTFRLLHDFPTKRVLCLSKEDVAHPAIGTLIVDFEPHVLEGSLSYLDTALTNILRDAREHSRGLHKRLKTIFADMQSIISLGDALTKVRAKHFASIFPHASIQREYGVGEFPNFTVACPQGDDRYHPFEESGVAVSIDGAGTSGEIVLSREGLEGHHTGDAGELVEADCDCGFPKTLIVHGRYKHDICHIAGATFLAADIEEILEGPTASAFTDYCVEVGERDKAGSTLGHVRLVLAHEDPSAMRGEATRLGELFLKALRVTPTRSLNDVIDQGLFLPLEVQVVSAIKRKGHKKFRLCEVS